MKTPRLPKQLKQPKHFRLLLLLLILVGCTEFEIPAWLTVSTATPTLSPTATASPTPTLTPTPSPTPTPTPQPVEILESAEEARRVGDWEVALRAYQIVLTQPGTPAEVATDATLGQAQVYVAMEAYSDAVTLLEAFLINHPDGDAAAGAHLLLADVARASGDTLRATRHYSQAMAIAPVLAPYVNAWLGDSYTAAGDYTAAIEAYQAALVETEGASQRVALLEKEALARAAEGDYEGAMGAYDAILGVSQYPSYRARIMRQAADTALAFGDTHEGYRRMKELVAAYPTDDHAYLALVTLVEVGEQVDDMLRGLVDYHAEAYGPAVQAFYRVLVNDPSHDGAPHYYAGLAFMEADSIELALDEFETLIETHTGDAYVAPAWMAKAAILADLGQLDTALDAYQTGVDAYGDRQEIPEPVWRALVHLEDAGAQAEVAELLVALADRYPKDTRAPEARFRAGSLYYRHGDVASAQEAWEALIAWYPYDSYAQGAWFWLGKTYMAEAETLDTDTGVSSTVALSATHALSQAMELGPWDFYGLQAADLLAERQPFGAHPAATVTCQSAAAQAEAEVWLADWLQLDPAANVAALPSELRDDDRLRRGSLLLRFGHFDEGRTELEQLRVATSGDPLTQYRLALYFRDIGLYRSSIIAATTLWQLSPAQDLATLPRFLGCLAYPTYYDRLVEEEAVAHGLSPLFIYALLRQESLFEGNATSYAAAHGLMQVIPPTGAYIAESLGWPPDYETHDLYRPMVSVKFGVWYLAEQMGLGDGNPYVAMAGYNGGPGNALRWWEMAAKDPALFVEIIEFEETRRYVRAVREHYAAYRWLYGTPDEIVLPAPDLQDSN